MASKMSDQNGVAELHWFDYLQHRMFKSICDRLPDEPLVDCDYARLFGLVWDSGLIDEHGTYEHDPKSVDGLKSASKSLTNMNVGKAVLQQGDLKRALDFLNKSVILAPRALPDAEDDQLPTVLSAAYSARSELLVRMRKYRECIADGLQAMKHGCADNELAPLFERLAVCCEQLGDFLSALNLCEEVMSMDESDDPSERKRLSAKLEKLQQLIDSNPNCVENRVMNVDFHPAPSKHVPTLFGGAGAHMLSLASAVELRVDKKTGTKHVFATKDIRQGSEFMIEKPLTVQNESRWNPIPTLFDGPSTTIPSGSSTLQLQAGSKAGEKCFVATKDIVAGSVLVVEKPFAWTLQNQTLYEKICSQCARTVVVVTPCRGCAMVVYCSEACEGKAWEDFHEIECLILPFIYHTMFKEFNIPKYSYFYAQRLVLRSIKQYFDMGKPDASRFVGSINPNATNTKSSTIEGDSCLPKADCDDIVLMLQATRPFNLNTAHCEGKRYINHVMLMCALILKVMRTVPTLQRFFPPAENHNQIKRLRKVLSTNLRHLNDIIARRMQLSESAAASSATSQRRTTAMPTGCEPLANSCETAPLDHIIGGLMTCLFVIFNEHKTSVLEMVVGAEDATLGSLSALRLVGEAYYPTYSLFKHSCYPHLIAVSHGPTVVAYAGRHIEKGEQVFIAYRGYSMLTKSVTSRQEHFSLNGFMCRCPACVEKLSTRSDLGLYPSLVCAHCRATVANHAIGRCRRCKRNIGPERTAFTQQWDSLRETYRRLYDVSADDPDALDTLLREYVAVDVKSRDPHRSGIHACAMLLLIFMFHLHGNRVYEYTDICIQ